MSDQGRWFKLWCSSTTDPHLDSLDVADFGRWAKFGAHVKEHGAEGTITLVPPERALCAMLQVDHYDALLVVLRKLPNVTVTGVTNVTVTFCNWHKYQGDNSAERTRQWRKSVTAKKRREEKRRDTTTTPPTPPRGEAESNGFDAFWNAYPRRKAKADALKAWAALRPDPDLQARLLAAVAAQKQSRDWQKAGGKYIPYPASWLRGQRWEDTVEDAYDPDALPPLRLEP